jgi:calcineurin-like phosphoesterase family protein
VSGSLAAAALLGAFAAAGPPSRDWQAHPAIVQLDTAERIFAIGDIHGDYDRLVALLVAGRVLARAPRVAGHPEWAAGKAVLVCTGDFIDKWGQSLQVIELLHGLQAAAAAAGGRVVVLIGNHEADFLAGRDHEPPSLAGELAAAGIAKEEVMAGRHPIGAFLRGLPFAARINGWFFSHAGNPRGRTLAQLDEELRRGVGAEGYGARVLSAPDSILEARLSGTPWWERPGQDPQASLGADLRALGVRHLAIGHQWKKIRFSDGSERKKGRMAQKSGQIFFLDVGMSRGAGDNEGALLRIEKDGLHESATAVLAGGASFPLWGD